jgi:hypothetical protein
VLGYSLGAAAFREKRGKKTLGFVPKVQQPPTIAMLVISRKAVTVASIKC